MTATWIPAARKFITANEGCRLTAYRDSCGVWTIGAGLTRLNNHPVYAGQRITQAQADAGLDYELGRTQALLERVVKVPLADHEAVALADFAYNLGAGALTTSTLLRLLNVGDREGAARQFLAWDKGHVGGRLVEIAGLRARREREQAMFLDKQGGPAPQAKMPAVPAASADALMEAELNRLDGAA